MIVELGLRNEETSTGKDQSKIYMGTREGGPAFYVSSPTAPLSYDIKALLIKDAVHLTKASITDRSVSRTGYRLRREIVGCWLLHHILIHLEW